MFRQTFKNPPKNTTATLTITYDLQLMLPVERKAQDIKGKLLYHYIYKNLKFNTGLTDKDFSPEVNGL